MSVRQHLMIFGNALFEIFKTVECDVKGLENQVLEESIATMTFHKSTHRDLRDVYIQRNCLPVNVLTSLQGVFNLKVDGKCKEQHL